MFHSGPNSEDPTIKRLLASVPADSGVTFSHAQLEVVKMAFGARKGSRSVNIRVSFPIWWRWYLVLLAGPDRRSPERNKEERMNHPLWVLGNALAIAVILLSIALLAVVFSDNLMSVFEETYFFFLRQLGHIKNLVGVV